MAHSPKQLCLRRAEKSIAAHIGIERGGAGLPLGQMPVCMDVFVSWTLSKLGRKKTRWERGCVDRARRLSRREDLVCLLFGWSTPQDAGGVEA